MGCNIDGYKFGSGDLTAAWLWVFELVVPANLKPDFPEMFWSLLSPSNDSYTGDFSLTFCPCFKIIDVIFRVIMSTQ